MSNKGKFYMTTAIAYTSGKPHIGNTYEIILADAIARYKRQEGYDVYFQTGTDEHGQKIEIKAKENETTPKQFVDGVAEEIFCDEESRFQMMQRVIKGRMLPLLILFFTVLLPQFISHLFYTRYYLIASLIGGVLAMYLTIFGMCFVKYTQYKNRRK